MLKIRILNVIKTVIIINDDEIINQKVIPNSVKFCKCLIRLHTLLSR